MTTDAYVGQQVHLLMWTRRVTNKRVAQDLGLAESTLSRKCRGTARWTVDDLLGVSALFGVPVQELLPHRDSNTEPTDYRLSTVPAAGYRPDSAGYQPGPIAVAA